MTEDRRRRSQKLVSDVRAALDRGVSPRQIHAALLLLDIPPDKATQLLNRIMGTRTAQVRPAQPAVAVPVAARPGFEAVDPAELRSASPETAARAVPGQVIMPPQVSAAIPHGRRRRVPFFLALAVLLMTVGFAGVHRSRAEEAARRAAEQAALAARLDSEVTAARAHLAHLEERLEARKVDAEQIEWLRARVARGPGSFEDPWDYGVMLARYERRREQWNETLPAYRVVADAFRTMVDIHNTKLDSLRVLRGPAASPAARQGVEGARYARIAAAVRPM